MIKTLSGTLTGNPTFTGGKVKCISEIELWVNRYQFIEGKQLICYQPQGGAKVCVEGDVHDLSSVIVSGHTFKEVNFNTASFGWDSFWYGENKGWIGNDFYDFEYFWYDINWGLHSGIPQDQYCRYFIIRRYKNGNVDANRSIDIFSVVIGHRFRETPFNLVSNYKIEIFKEGQKVHEHTSSNPISAWSETSSDKCVEGNWKKESSWVQFPFDTLKVQRLGDVYWFWLQRGLLTSPVAIIRKKDNCKMPLYKLVVKPKWGKCEEKPEKKCPSGTVESFEHNGFLCCYNKEGNLIKSIKL